MIKRLSQKVKNFLRNEKKERTKIGYKKDKE